MKIDWGRFSTLDDDGNCGQGERFWKENRLLYLKKEEGSSKGIHTFMR